MATPTDTIEPEVTPGTPSAPAGKYKLLVHIWNELVSEPGKAKQFVKHVLGDIVELNPEDADRLLRGGAVAPISNEAKAAAADIGPTALDKAQATNAADGPKPIDPAAPPAA
jgi:hypothetical protein